MSADVVELSDIEKYCRCRCNHFKDVATGFKGIKVDVIAKDKRTEVLGLVIAVAAFVIVSCCIYLIDAGSSLLLRVVFYIFTILVFVLIWRIVFCLFTIHKECVVFIPRVGMQTSKTSLLRHYVHFIPYSLIKDVVVNEAIQQYRIVVYLAMLLHQPQKSDKKINAVSPLFENQKLSMKVIVYLYREIKTVLMDVKNQ